MWDDQHEREMMRNQMVAIAVMTALLMGWYFFLVPQPQPEQPVPHMDGPPGAQSIADPVPTLSGGDPSAIASTDPAATISTEWPNLPPVAAENVADDLVTISDEFLILEFTRVGARLKRATVIIEEELGGNIQLIPESSADVDALANYPLGLRFTDERLGDALDRRRYDASVDPSGRSVTFTLELPGAARITKQFSLSASEHVLDVRVNYESLEDQTRLFGLDVTPAYTLGWTPGVYGGEEGRFQPSMVWRVLDENEILATGKLEDHTAVEGGKRVPDVSWIGHKGKYFLVALRAPDATADAFIEGTMEDFRFSLGVPRFELAPGQAQSSQFQVYLGPVHLSSLTRAWDTLPTSLRFFDSVDFMDSFAKLLLRALNWFHDNLFASYGIAIILLTVLVRIIMFPLTLKSMRNMKAMQALQPEMEEIRKEYEDDQQELSRQMMELYRERGINPMMGCFPMLLQMPVFIALYRMLWYAFELRGASFLYVDDLSQPDKLFELPFLAGVPFVGQYIQYFNLFPILMGIAMMLSMKIMPTSGPAQNPQQKMIMNIMPWMFAVISYGFSAGLNLYVLTSTILGIAQQYVVKPAVKTPDTAAKAKKKPRGKAQHFYDRAQEKKREQAKAAKKGKKKNKAKS